MTIKIINSISLDSRIRFATEADIKIVYSLFSEYAESLGIDLVGQNFEEELAGLPGPYAPPSGAVLLAFDVNKPVGCVGLRAFKSEGTCELKRLYVRETSRGIGLGQRLLEGAITAARAAGYREMVLDSLTKLERAISMYRRAGFVETAPYWRNPLTDVIYWRRSLNDPAARF